MAKKKADPKVEHDFTKGALRLPGGRVVKTQEEYDALESGQETPEEAPEGGEAPESEDEGQSKRKRGS